MEIFRVVVFESDEKTFTERVLFSGTYELCEDFIAKNKEKYEGNLWVKDKANNIVGITRIL